MPELSLADRKVIAIGERDGIAGPSIEAVVQASGGHVVLSVTACFV